MIADAAPGTTPVPAGDLVLPADIHAGRGTASGTGPDVLLTGATGYLGAYLLRELMAGNAGTVWCLIRADDDSAAAARLAARCAELGLVPARTRALAGDFTQTGFGVSHKVYQELAARVGAVYHCGASVNMNDPYALARIPNVRGTVEVLRFATHGPVKTVHHISTMAVFIAARAAGLTEVDDDVVPALAHSGTFGYAASKCVAEMLVRQAAQRGVPTAIYRPPMLPGDSVTGASSDTEPLTTFMKVCVQLQAAPRALPGVPACATDHAGRAIAALAGTAPAPGRTRAFNLHNAAPLPLVDTVRALNRAGQRVTTVATGEWLTRLTAQRRIRPARSLYAMSEMLPYLVCSTPAHELPAITASRTVAAKLNTLGITAPPMDEHFLDTLVSHLRPAPSTSLP